MDSKTKYRYSPLFFSPSILLLILIVGVIFLGNGLIKIFEKVGYESFTFIIPGLLFLLIFLGPIVFNNMHSPFQKSRKLIQSYTGGGSIGWIVFTTPFFRLLHYQDGLEIRVFFNAFFIPYEKLLRNKGEKGLFSNGQMIHTDLPGVPSRIRFSNSSKDNIIELIKETIENNQNSTEPYKQPMEKAVSDKKKKYKGIFTISKKSIKDNKKLFVGLALLEITVFYLTGPMTIAWKQLTHQPSNENIKLLKRNEYKPIDESRAPKKYNIVEVKHDGNNEVVAEKFYHLSGEIIALYFQNGKCIRTRYTNYCTFVLAAFALTGMGLLLIFEPLSVYSFTLLFTSAILMFSELIFRYL